MGQLSQDTINTWIVYAKISQCLATQEIESDKFIKGSSRIPEKLPSLLLFTQTIVSWSQQYYLGEPEFELVAKYMYALCGKYILYAQKILQNPGSGIIVTPTGNQPVNIATRIFQFTVAADLSPFVVNGSQSVYSIADNNILINSLDFFLSGIQLTRNDPTEVSYLDQYFTNGMTITLNQAVVPGQEYMGRYWVLTSGGSVVPPGSGLPPTFGQSGKFLANDGNDAFWNAAQIELTSADFDLDGVTWIPSGDNTRVTAFDIEIRFENANVLWVEGTDWIRNFSDGGFTVLVPGFNANLDPNLTLTVNLFPKTTP